MRVDLLDVSFRIKKDTGIELTQRDWQSLLTDGDITVGDLYSLLLYRLKYSSDLKTDLQLNESVWQRTRLALAQVADIPAKEVTLSRRLNALLPEPSRLELWKRFQETLQLSVPQLELPRSVRRLQSFEAYMILLAVPMIPAAIIASKFLRDIEPGRWWLIPIVYACSLLACSQVYSGFGRFSHRERRRRILPTGLETVKDLCRQVRDLNAFRLIGRPYTQNLYEGEKVWNSLKECLVNALGVDHDEVTLQARLIRDLGAE